MPGDKIFLDTNIIIYAYDVSAGEKHKKASTILVEDDQEYFTIYGLENKKQVIFKVHGMLGNSSIVLVFCFFLECCDCVTAFFWLCRCE